jgi:hypothetical protein
MDFNYRHLLSEINSFFPFESLLILKKKIQAKKTTLVIFDKSTPIMNKFGIQKY